MGSSESIELSLIGPIDTLSLETRERVGIDKEAILSPGERVKLVRQKYGVRVLRSWYIKMQLNNSRLLSN